MTTTHPLDPLTADEIARAWQILRAQTEVGARPRVITIALDEPARDAVSAHRPGAAAGRAASVVFMDGAAGRTYEATVSLTDKRLVSCDHVPGVQPSIVYDEFVEAEAAVRADPRWQEAMRKR